MVVGLALLVISVLIIAIWVFIEFKRMRHKIFAIFIIVLIIFSYVSFSLVLKGQDIDYTTASGVGQATKLYFLWLGSAFGNMKVITTNAIKMDWSGNESIK